MATLRDEIKRLNKEIELLKLEIDLLKLKKQDIGWPVVSFLVVPYSPPSCPDYPPYQPTIYETPRITCKSDWNNYSIKSERGVFIG